MSTKSFAICGFYGIILYIIGQVIMSHEGDRMKYVWTLIWSFLLAHMVTYVVGSIHGDVYSFETGNFLAVSLFILVLFVPLILPKNEQATEK